MPLDDTSRLHHMLDAAEEAAAFVRGKSREDLEKNRQLVLALVKSIEIIGEAATKVSVATRNRFSGIPWQDITSMRNRLIHAYFDVDLNRLWDTVVDDLPSLIEQLRAALQ